MKVIEPLPGEVWMISIRIEILSNPRSDVRLNIQKSAEVIVPRSGMSLKEREYELNGKD